MALTNKEGDRVSEDHGEQVVITPPDTSKTKFNFGPASSRDAIVYTCERPGGDPSLHGDGTNTKLVPSIVLPDWIEYIQKSKGITNVIVLLGDNEMQDYSEDGLLTAYKAHGMTAHHIAFSSPNSAVRIAQLLQEIKAKNEKVVAHCTHGMGRSGRVAAFWSTQEYGLSPEMATDEVLETAREAGVERMGAVRQLKDWIATLPESQS